MHLNDDLLRALYDQELTDAQTLSARAHLSGCPTCQNRLDQISARAQRVQVQFDRLNAGNPAQPSSTQAAYRHFATSSRLYSQKKETLRTMFTRRPIWTVLAVIALLAMVFTLTPARAWASDFLGLFRVEKVQVIAFNQDAVEETQTRMEVHQEAFERIFQEDMQVTEHQVPETVVSTEEAAGIIGFTPRLPADMSGAELRIQPGFDAIFTIDQPKLQELIDVMGAEFTLPEAANGQVVTMNVPDALTANADCSEDPDMVYRCLSLIQLRSPVVDAPDGMPVEEIGAAMFTFLGMPEDEAREMSQRIDWTTTLVIPVPSDGAVQVKDVNVDGVTGSLFLQPIRNGFVLVWVKDGILYGLSGTGGEMDALQIAGSIQQ
jgi:anti-sigma factor RsiW